MSQANEANREESYFDGGLLQYIGWRILGFLVTVCTLGICLPWSYTMIYRWKIEHTVINGRRLTFNGSAIGLFGNWIKWWFFTVITLGIYGFWVFIKLEKWKTKYTTFA
ncbi:YjgN family protein [Bacillus andreraoultii]|uniref:membrane protein n=1 Tax=Bacillus andreraoultii TaxID=1499685 RepID=UPI000539F262|nr:membrane protein [Bacillus andreraoultii]